MSFKNHSFSLLFAVAAVLAFMGFTHPAKADRPTVELGKVGVASAFNGRTGLALVADAITIGRVSGPSDELTLNLGLFVEQRQRNVWDNFVVGPQANFAMGRVFCAAAWDPAERDTRFLVGVRIF